MRAPLPWSRAGDAVARLFGLRFGRERPDDLRRVLDGAAAELQLPVGSLLEDLAGDRLDDAARRVLASHLTVGETYFFRGPELLEALRHRVLPALAAARSGARRLRFWSAGCATGEEPYTLAMLLREVIPDIDAWQVSILATDLNPRFLHKARQGFYGEWSFRATPEVLRRRHFRPAGTGQWAIDPAIRAMVDFLPLNLSEGAYPSIATGTHGMDLVLCRNVLMYFDEAQARLVLSRLRASLREDGLLSVAPCEASAVFDGFETIRHGDATFYRPATVDQAAIAASPIDSLRASNADVARLSPHPQPRRSRSSGASRGVVDASRPTPAGSPLGYRAKLLADQGHLRQARALCDAWVAESRLDVGAHYLRALVAIELGDHATADASLRHCAYLAPREAIVHFSMGHLHRLRGRSASAVRAWRHALALCASAPDDAPVPYSDGLQAGQLRALIGSLLETEGLDEQAA